LIGKGAGKQQYPADVHHASGDKAMWDIASEVFVHILIGQWVY